ncbi:cytosolic leucyl tRNA synthetase, partial [Spiromyces aspiralis]
MTANPDNFAPATASAVTEESKKTAKRDFLIANEKKWQDEWEANRLFEQDLPADWDSLSVEELHEKYPKFMGTFPFP